jgi:predicted secreted protein with PEFG-CTERM motif
MTAYAQSQLIFLETSQNSYEEGDTIVVSGNVTSIIAGEQVSLTIFREGNLVDIAQIEIAQDGNYAHTFIAKGPLWQKDGNYIVRALYGKTTIETSFDFYSKQALIETTDIFEVDAGSYGTFDIDYTIRGATVKEMIVDSEIFALIVILETDDDGAITLKLPRESIDATKTGDQDDTFIILIDGIEVPYRETSTNADSRTIIIEFEEGDSDIEIIGTFVVPEFGNIVMIILVIGIVSTILLSTKYRIPIKI